MADGNELSSAPDFRLHRDEVGAIDGAAVLAEEHRGINAHQYEYLLANLECDAGAGAHTATFEALFWSPLARKYVSEATPLVWVVPHGTTVAVRIPVLGRKCFLAVTQLSAGRKASAEVAAFLVDPRYD